MKKKLILSMLVVVAMMCLFAISVGATAIDKDTTVTLDGSFTDANGSAVTAVNLYDADGDALIWYLNTDGKLVSAKIASVVTVNSEGVISFTDKSIFLNSTPYKSVIAVNLRDNVKVSGTAHCQASATPKNISKGERHPKHFFGLKLIDKTIFCKVSSSKE
ncbi:MAG: hypothetical protein J6D23_07990 [Clostridia bacterium]|nr:hypothetical protein [Clostridia bacterium]